MEIIKKRILQVLTTGMTATTGGNKYIIVPDLTAVYNMKIGLCSIVKDIGFFDTIPIIAYYPYYPYPYYQYGYGWGALPVGLNNLF